MTKTSKHNSAPKSARPAPKSERRLKASVPPPSTKRSKNVAPRPRLEDESEEELRIRVAEMEAELSALKKAAEQKGYERVVRKQDEEWERMESVLKLSTTEERERWLPGAHRQTLGDAFCAAVTGNDYRYTAHNLASEACKIIAAETAVLQAALRDCKSAKRESFDGRLCNEADIMNVLKGIRARARAADAFDAFMSRANAKEGAQ